MTVKNLLTLEFIISEFKHEKRNKPPVTKFSIEFEHEQELVKRRLGPPHHKEVSWAG
jgi:hypothetical protein